MFSLRPGYEMALEDVMVCVFLYSFILLLQLLELKEIHKCILPALTDIHCFCLFVTLHNMRRHSEYGKYWKQFRNGYFIY